MSRNTHLLPIGLTSLAFIYFLCLPLESAMVTLSQTSLVAYPVMGYGKARTALMKASQQAVRKKDITTSLSADESARHTPVSVAH